jgi:putative GTP pyrophosphokinase
VVVALPVYLVKGKRIVPVEVQFRSIAMDAWASLEHELRYKNREAVTEDIVKTLKECAETLHYVDERMTRVRHEVLKDESKYSNF